jgi:lipopolysaccharide heptosyltransferase II
MSHQWAAARRILAIRLDSLGDVLMTGPALRALAADGASVTLLTSPAGAEAARLLPGVEDVIAYDAPWMKATMPRRGADPDHAMISTLRGRRFDAAVIFTVHSQSPLPAAMLCYLAAVPLRAAHCHENPYQLLTDWVRDPEPALERHEVERQLALVAKLGFAPADAALAVNLPAEAVQRVDALLAELGLDERRPWAVLHPGASAPSRRYPIDRYAAAGRGLVKEHGWQVVVAGGEDEAELAEQLVDQLRAGAFSLAGRLSLAELGALLARAPVVIGNNSGPAHLAAAVGTPVVVLYALTNPQHTPWGVPSRVLFHDVPCRNCGSSVCVTGHHLCLLGVPETDVAMAAIELYDAAATERVLSA